MLEGFALKLLFLGEGELVLLGLLLVFTGFLLALCFRRGATLSLPRLPYFLWSATVYLLVSALPFAWLLTFVAASHGVFWLVALPVFGTIFASGVAAGVLGHARSVSAYGDGRHAWMALVPVVNLVLFFKPPADWTKETSEVNLSNTALVVLGFALATVGHGLGKAAKEDIAAMHRRVDSDPALQRVNLDMVLRGRGLEKTLRAIADGVRTQRIDDVTTLLRVEADGTTLHYVYEVSTHLPQLPPSVRDGIVTENCTQEALRPVIEAGATIEHVFHRADGPDFGTVTVTRTLCGY